MKGDNHFLLDLEGVFEKLKEKGASQDVSLYVEDLLVQQHQRYHNFMTAEADKRRRLLEHVQKLQVTSSPLLMHSWQRSFSQELVLVKKSCRHGAESTCFRRV